MSDDYSDVGASEKHEADHANMTDDGDVELNLPLEVLVEEQVRTREDIRKPPGAINPGVMALDTEERHRFEPPNVARSKWPRHRLPNPSILEPRSPGTGATANVGESGANRRGFGLRSPRSDFFGTQQRRQSGGVETPSRVDLKRKLDFPGLGGQLLGMGHKLIQTLTQMFEQGILIRIDGTSLMLAVADRI